MLVLVFSFYAPVSVSWRCKSVHLQASWELDYVYDSEESILAFNRVATALYIVLQVMIPKANIIITFTSIHTPFMKQAVASS